MSRFKLQPSINDFQKALKRILFIRDSLIILVFHEVTISILIMV
jgi:hypothetical protein